MRVILSIRSGFRLKFNIVYIHILWASGYTRSDDIIIISAAQYNYCLNERNVADGEIGTLSREFDCCRIITVAFKRCVRIIGQVILCRLERYYYNIIYKFITFT